MTDRKKDLESNLIDFILSDETPVQPDGRGDIDLFNTAVATAKQKLARARMERAKAGVAAGERGAAKVVDLESARRLFERAKAGDETARVTLAARFGDGTMDGDMDAILEDLAELEAEDREED